jgi:hypothetical protein
MGKGPNGLSQSPWPIWLFSLDWHNGPAIVKDEEAKWQCGKQMSQGADGKKEMNEWPRGKWEEGIPSKINAKRNIWVEGMTRDKRRVE